MSSVKFIDDEDGFQFGAYCDGRTGGIIKLAAGAEKKRARPRTSDLVSWRFVANIFNLNLLVHFQMFKVLEGSVEIERDNDTFLLEANDFLIVKVKSSYRIHNKSASEAIILAKRDD